jgi:hypothetical protein
MIEANASKKLVKQRRVGNILRYAKKFPKGHDFLISLEELGFRPLIISNKIDREITCHERNQE